MTPPRNDGQVEHLLDLAGRIMLTHGVDPADAADAIGITTDAVRAMIAGRVVTTVLDAEQRQRVTLFVNLLVRMEVVLWHDPAAIRRTLATLIAAAAPRLAHDPLAALRMAREAIERLDRSRERWWRVGHNG